MIYDIVEGTTDPLQFQLLEAGSSVDLTDSTVSLLLEDNSGATVSAGVITVSDAPTGRVTLAPASSSTFVASVGPYYARWKITSLAGTFSFVPSSIRDVWNIIGV